MDTKHVVITGLGAVTSLGNTAEETWRRVRAGEVGLGPLTKFDPEPYACKVASEVHDLDTDAYLERKEVRRMDPFTIYALVSVIQALRDAELDQPGALVPERTGVMLGVGFGGVQSFEDACIKLYQRGPSGVPPLFIPKFMGNAAVGQIAMKFGLTGPSLVISSACTSATDAIGRALRCIRAGMCDVMVTGGSEALISPITFAGFGNLQALSTDFNHDPQLASRPFDKDRDGFILGEGAGILVLEAAEHAAARGARAYAELAGYGATCDAFHLTAPHAEGLGAQSAMRMAIRTAGLAPDEVDYVNAHGTSTPLNDPIETAAIKGVFGEHAYRLKISSTKSMIGHLLGGAGGAEAVVVAKALDEQFYPATANLDQPDPACDLDYVAKQGVAQPMRAAISNSFGFGGHNGVIAMKRISE